MARHVCLLRGVNVTGYNKVAMPALRGVLEGLGLRDVTTYLQSGNAVFSANRPSAAAIQAAIADELGVSVRVLLRSDKEMASVVARKPFAGHDGVHVTFLENVADASLAVSVPPEAGAPDEFVIDGSQVYLRCPGGYGRTRLNNSFWERRLRTVATTRNWNSVTKLEELAAG